MKSCFTYLFAFFLTVVLMAHFQNGDKGQLPESEFEILTIQDEESGKDIVRVYMNKDVRVKKELNFSSSLNNKLV